MSVYLGSNLVSPQGGIVLDSTALPKDFSELTTLPQAPASSDLLAIRSGSDTYKATFDAVKSAMLDSFVPGTKIVPTLSAGTAYESFGGVWYRRVGYLVEVHVGINLTSESAIFTLPSGYIPPVRVGFKGEGMSLAHISNVDIDTSGVVNVTPSNNYALVHCVYFVDE